MNITKASTEQYPNGCLKNFMGHSIFLKDAPSSTHLTPRLVYRVGSQGILQPWRIVNVCNDTLALYKKGELLSAANALKAGISNKGFIFHGQNRELFCLESVPEKKLVERVTLYLDSSRPNTEVIEYYEMYKETSGKLWIRGSSLVNPLFWHWGPVPIVECETQKMQYHTKDELLGS